MAFALIHDACQLVPRQPNILRVFVMGGMLVTAFLPAHMSVKAKLRRPRRQRIRQQHHEHRFHRAWSRGACLPSIALPDSFTQSFMNDQSTMDDAIFFFRFFFAIRIVFTDSRQSSARPVLNAS